MSDSGFTTNVPPITFTPTGPVAPSDQAVLNGVMADMQGAFGSNLNPQLSTPQGQIASTETAVISDSNAAFLAYVAGVDPATSTGRMQDGIGRIYFQTRIPAKPTVQAVICAGLNVTIPIGAMAADENGNLWICEEQGEISNGSVTLNFQAIVTGPIPGPQTLEIYQGPFGWESATPTGSAVIGENVESPSQFEARRKASVAANAIQILDSIQGTVLALPGVLDCYCAENPTAGPVAVGSGLKIIGPNSVYVCVLGGVASAIAQAIWTKKGPGCAYNGNTPVVVSDPNPAYNAPAPSYTVTFQTPSIASFAVWVDLLNNPGIPANALALIQQAVINAFAGLDGGPRAKIGSLVLASRLYGPIMALGSWAQAINIQIGLLGDGAHFTGAITGNVLTVSSLTAGTVSLTALLQDAGLINGKGLYVVNQLSGTPGGNGTYTISAPVLVPIAPEAMTTTTLVFDYLVPIDQAPAVAATNVNLVVTSG